MALVNEWIFELFDTSSDEIIARAKQEDEEYYLPKLNEQSATIEQLTSQIDSLKSILKQHNISFG